MSQPQANNNVTRLNQGRVYNHITTFLINTAKKSENTAAKYERDIRRFFKYVCDKDIEDLEPDDLDVDYIEVIEYQNFLADQYKNSTVNNSLTGLISLYRTLKRNKYDVNPENFKLDELPDDSDRIGFLTPDEAKYLARLAYTERFNGAMKEALILLAASTSLRKTAIRKLRYCDITPSPDGNQDKFIIYSSENRDKGKKVEKEIHRVVYEKLLAFKGDKKDDELIFEINNVGISKMMQRLCSKAGIDPSRRVSFHSLKKAGVQFAKDYTKGDMLAVKNQGGWRSMQMTTVYLEEQRNVAGMGMFEEIDDSIYDKLTRDELLALIKGIGNGVGASLRNDAKKIVDGRKM
jgi:integrase